jgi:hypothetical protein
LGFNTERRWLRFVGRRLGHLFPYLPTSSAYNRRLRRAAPLVALAINDVAAHTPSFGDQLRLVDSTPVPCAASRETVKRSALAGHAGYGYCKSHHRFFWGFRLYLLAAPDGLPVAWCLATPKLGEREVVAALLNHERARLRPGLVIAADKGLAGRDFEQLVTGHGAVLVRPDRADEPPRHGSLAAGANGSRAPSTPSNTSSGWNATRDGPWPASRSAQRSGCWRWRPRSGGTGRPAHPTSAAWSPTTTEAPPTQSEAII